ncbi:hypothetical protein LTR53_005298 [Teratosphaeriaceae sp. CCFEE 6253]|nr:hypothetical protein LTR53_005298 [Teratosphaeriaceae sp. CCFEE 6253]
MASAAPCTATPPQEHDDMHDDGESQLTRMQRALGLAQRGKFSPAQCEHMQEQEDGGIVTGHGDYRRCADLAFEGDVYFLAIETDLSQDVEGRVSLRIGLATLETRDLADMAPGPDGEFWRENTRWDVEQGWDMDEKSVAALRERVACCFQGPINPDPEHTAPDEYDFEARNVIVVAFDVQKVLNDLQAIRLDPRWQMNVVDVIDLADLARAHWHRQGLGGWTLPVEATLRDILLVLDLPCVPPGMDDLEFPRHADNLLAFRAQSIVEAVVMCAARNRGLHFTDGGEFPGPWCSPPHDPEDMDIGNAEPPSATDLPAATPVLTLPPFPQFALNAYKNAAENFANGLVEAAWPCCDVFLYAIRARSQTRFLRDGTPRDSWLISPAASYSSLVAIVSSERPAAIEPWLMAELEYEILGRQSVDDWYGSLPQGDPRRSALRGHQEFTATLRTIQRWLTEAMIPE